MRTWIAVAALASGCTLFESVAPDDPPEPTTGHGYIISDFTLPDDTPSATALGLDLDGLPADGVDNQLGQLLGGLRGLVPDLGAAEALDAAVDRGVVLGLIDVRADDLVNSRGVRARFHVGDVTQPPPCSGPGDVVCRQHLTGTASATLAPDIAPGAPLVGAIVNGQLAASGGDLVIPMVLADGGFALVPLRRAQVRLFLDPDRVRLGIVGGALTIDDLDTLILAQLHAGLRARFERDCFAPRLPPTCGCRSGSSGAEIVAFLDQDGDCDPRRDEFLDLMHSLLAFDQDLDDDGVNDAVSLGFGIAAARVDFPPP